MVNNTTISAVFKTTLFMMHIETTKTITFLRVDIKPTRPTISTLNTHQV